MGVLILQGREPNWQQHLDDLLLILSREMGALMAYEQAEVNSVELEKYQELARIRSELLANVSHELRTPLGLIRGYAETIVRGVQQLDHSSIEEYARIIAEESFQLESEIHQLLQMSLLEATGNQVAKIRFSLQQWIARLRQRLLPRDRFQLTVHIQRDISFVGDPDRMLEVVTNLADNALKYSEGMIHLSVTYESMELRLEVTDEGEGVQVNELEKIFDRFYRSTLHANSSRRGSGLGLSIARSIVEAHGGTIWAENLFPGFKIGFAIPNQESVGR